MNVILNFNYHNFMFSRHLLNKNIEIISLVLLRTREIIHIGTVFRIIHKKFKFTIINLSTLNIEISLLNNIVVEIIH